VNVVLRPYDSADFDALFQLDRACYPPGIAYSKSMLRWFLRLRGLICTIAEATGSTADSIQGFILAEAEPPRGHIITLDVAQEFRRRGVGTALLHHAEQTAGARGIRLMELETATDNIAGVAFWSRHGYRTIGITPRYYLGRVDAYFMRKKLDSSVSHSKEA
jgi:[ribosomal protein S18]-alanine N-acetyltransferase